MTQPLRLGVSVMPGRTAAQAAAEPRATILGRRKFIARAGAALASIGAPRFVATAQPAERPKRVGVIIGTANSTLGQSEFETVRQGLKELGWTEGSKLRIDARWAGGDVDLMRKYAAELVALAPDAILCNSTPLAAAVLRETATIPVVFVVVTDPVGAGFIKTIARPGGNATGLTNFEGSMAGKWLELLKEIAPAVSRAGLLFDPETAPGGGEFFVQPFAAAASSFHVAPVRLPAAGVGEIETRIAKFAREPGGSLVVTPDVSTAEHRKQIIALAARYRLPAIYPYRFFATDGGLISYGVDILDLFRRATSYVDRILRGAKPADLPVEAPTKFQLVINLKTAKAQGFAIPGSLLAQADGVIE